MQANGYAHPEALVDTDWVAQHLKDPKLRLVEVDVDTAAYDTGHIPGAIGWNWKRDTQQTVRRDIPDRTAFEELLGRSGIANNSTVVVYGDNNNWFATFAYWLFRMYGHPDVRVMNGGRKKWVNENRPLTADPPMVTPVTYRAKEPDTALRATRDGVQDGLGKAGHALVDVRSPKEYAGELLGRRTCPRRARSAAATFPAR